MTRRLVLPAQKRAGPTPADPRLSRTIEIPIAAICEHSTHTRAAHMDVVVPGQKTFRVSLDSRNCTIGREDDCRICLPITSVSRRHARISLSGEDFALEDQGSTNGTYVNGVRISRCLLRDGDQIRIGEAQLAFSSAKIKTRA